MSAIYLLKSVPETVLDVSALLSLKRREIKSFFFPPMCVSFFACLFAVNDQFMLICFKNTLTLNTTGSQDSHHQVYNILAPYC